MSTLQIETRDVDAGTVVVRLIGAADLGGSDAFQRQLTQLSARRPARVVFDLSDLTLISSLCIGALVSYRRAHEGWNGRATLAGAVGPVETSLRRCKLDQLFTFAPSVDEALAS